MPRDFTRRPARRPHGPTGPTDVALFETADDDNGDYPDPAEAFIVYPAKRALNPTYTQQTGSDDLTYDLGDTVVFVGAGSLGVLDKSPGYVSKGSLVLCERVNNRWWIRGLLREPQ